MKRTQGQYVEPEWKEHWLEFELAMSRRLMAGHREYGDHSFSREPRELLGELEEEALDIVGWGYILWCRLRRLQEALDR